jgi:hypothetical protein
MPFGMGDVDITNRLIKYAKELAQAQAPKTGVLFSFRFLRYYQKSENIAKEKDRCSLNMYIRSLLCFVDAVHVICGLGSSFPRQYEHSPRSSLELLYY